MNAKIEAESDELKKKEYYASAEYTRIEKKKKKIGTARQKTKVVRICAPLFLRNLKFSKIEN